MGGPGIFWKPYLDFLGLLLLGDWLGDLGRGRHGFRQARDLRAFKGQVAELVAMLVERTTHYGAQRGLGPREAWGPERNTSKCRFPEHASRAAHMNEPPQASWPLLLYVHRTSNPTCHAVFKIYFLSPFHTLWNVDPTGQGRFCFFCSLLHP